MMSRVWEYEKDQSGSVHCLSNGAFCVYGKGPDLLQVFGPPFSSGSVCGLRLTEKNMRAESERLRGTNTWVHRLWRHDKFIGTFTDFMAQDINVFMRIAELKEPVTAEIVPTEKTQQSGEIFCLPKGSFIYMDYPSPNDTFVAVSVEGGTLSDRKCCFHPGKSVLYLAGGTDCEELQQMLSVVKERGYAPYREESEKDWNSYVSSIKYDFDTEKFSKIVSLAEDVAVLIRAQQSLEGGVLAGYNYHLGYVRDQYGVYRCLMKLGLTREAKKILEFYLNVYRCGGAIHNAQGIGVSDLYHVHENDGSEITGYLVLQAVDYYERTGDDKFFCSMFPLLRYCLERQIACLHRAMLPFNGDETYIAGGFLNRFVMDEGSAEATLLFITGTERLLRAVRAFGEDFSVYEPAVAAAKSSFRKNFVLQGKLACNAPERRIGLEFPVSRHGVCVGCGAFGDLVLNESGYDVCKKCEGRSFQYKSKRYFLPSVGLAPLYMGADIFSREELVSFASESIVAYKILDEEPETEVGYESGLLLYAMIALKEDKMFIKKLADRVIRLADDTGAWAEYYSFGRPYNTRCRAWESGINLEALLCFAEQEQTEKVL